MEPLQLHLIQRKALFKGPVKLDRDEIIPTEDPRVMSQFARMADMWGIEQECYDADDYVMADAIFRYTKRFVWPGATSDLPMKLFEHHRDELLQRCREGGNVHLATEAELLWAGLRVAEESPISEQLHALIRHISAKIFGTGDSRERPESADKMTAVLEADIKARERYRVRPRIAQPRLHPAPVRPQ